MSKLMRAMTSVVSVMAVAGLAACEDDATGPTAAPGTGTVSLSVALAGGGGGAGGPAPAVALHADGLELTDGTHTLVIASAEVVLREIELERVRDLADCVPANGDDDRCEEFETDPMLVSLPLDGSVARQITTAVDTGTYEEIEFEVHKLDDDDPRDADLLAQDPALDDISIRVAGTFDGEEFLFTSDLNEEQEIELADPLVVTEGSGEANVTLTIDLASWFRTTGGTLIDPRTALKGGPNEDRVEENIEVSIEGFRDDDGDGRSGSGGGGV